MIAAQSPATTIEVAGSPAPISLPLRSPARLAIVWWCGPAAAAFRVLGHGESGRTAAVVLAVAGLVVSAALVVRVQRAVRLAVVVCAAAAAVAVAAPLVGRSPLVVTFAGAALGWVCCCAPHRRLEPVRDALAVAALPLVVAAPLWIATGSLALWLAASALSCTAATMVVTSPAWADAGRRTVRAAVLAARRWSAALERASERVVPHLYGTATAGDPSVPSVPWGPMAAAVAAGAVATMPVFARLTGDWSFRVLTVNDYNMHLPLAEQMADLPRQPSTPHFLFHIVVGPLSNVFDLRWTAVAVLGLSVGATCAVLVLLAGRGVPTGLAAWPQDPPGLRGWASLALPAAFLLTESPAVALQAAGIVSPDAGFMPVHFYGSPTQVYMLPFALVTLVLLAIVSEADATEAGGPATARRRVVRVALGISAVCVTLAHPAFTLAYAVGAPAGLVAVGRWRSATARTVVGWFVLPAVAVAVWQTWFQVTRQSEMASNSFAIDPFETAHVLGLDRMGPAFPLAAAVVVLAVVVGRSRFLRDPLVSMTLGALAVSMAILLLLVETGERATDGNLGKPGFTAWVILYLLSARFLLLELGALLRRRSTVGAPRPGWVGAFAVVAVAMVIGGVVAHLGAAGVVDLPQPVPG